LKENYTIIKSGPNVGKRKYDEMLLGVEGMLISEMGLFFINSLNSGLKILYLRCEKNHSITINKKDLEFLNTFFDPFEQKPPHNHIFSKKTKIIKNFQYMDFLKIFNFPNIESFLIYPYLDKNNFFYYDIILIVNDQFNYVLFLKLQFKLIKIKSFSQLYDKDITFEFMCFLYDPFTIKLKNSLFAGGELSKCYNYNEMELPEKIALDDICEAHILFMKQNNGLVSIEMKLKIDELIYKLGEKTKKLLDKELYKFFYFTKLCRHFYSFNKDLFNDTIFFTNYLEVCGGVGIIPRGDSIVIDNDQVYSLEDLYD
jgi:hypothetical protein